MCARKDDEREGHLALVGEGDDDDFIRLPGLFPRWDLERVIEPGVGYAIEDAGSAEDGTPLFFVFRREHIDVEEAAP